MLWLSDLSIWAFCIVKLGPAQTGYSRPSPSFPPLWSCLLSAVYHRGVGRIVITRPHKSPVMSFYLRHAAMKDMELMLLVLFLYIVGNTLKQNEKKGCMLKDEKILQEEKQRNDTGDSTGPFNCL